MALARGLYGPQPYEILGKTSLLRARRSLYLAAVVGRHVVRLRGLRPLTENDRQAIARFMQSAAFKSWMPERLPAGFRVTKADLPPYSCDVLTMHFSDETGRSFEIVQRKRWLPLLEELDAAKVPFDRVPGVRQPLYIVHGKYGGEPIDRSFWSTRRGLQFELGELAVEMREVIGRGPGLAALISLAASSRIGGD